MDLIGLKVPPERLALMIDAVDHYQKHGDWTGDGKDLDQVITWLRYRYSRWAARQATTPAA
jgi:hypothetical protein